MDDVRELSPAAYPPLLREIPDCPTTLYVCGELPAPETTLLTIVGSRKHTAYGRDVLDTLLCGLRGYPISIVSGLALGTDCHAHTAALELGLHTIAVPGSGLSHRVLYPRSHVRLAENILEHGGCLLSEFPLEQRAAPWTFPQRNRLMAGMSHATLLIEATQRSGTLITARLATEYNRDVLVVPGSIFSESAQGVHQFLKLGATPVTHADDIVQALGIEATAPLESQKVTLFDLSPQEQEIFDILAEPCTRDELLARLTFSAREASIVLSKLELKGVIEEKLGTLRRAFPA